MQVDREILTIFYESGETSICVCSFVMFISEFIFAPIICSLKVCHLYPFNN